MHLDNICILWDFDNTLAYRDGMWTQSLVNVLGNNGYNHIDSKLISKVFETGFPWHRHKEAHSAYFNNMTWWDYVNTLISKALHAIGITNIEENKKLTCQFKDEYLRIDAWHLFEDTICNLEYSHLQGYSNAILSNHTPELEELVEGLGIRNYFEIVITSGKVGYEKPHPKFFQEIYKYGKYDRCYMIGDSYNADIVGGINCGFTSILVRKENTMQYEQYSKYLDGIWQFIN